jgi:hypothetical protein
MRSSISTAESNCSAARKAAASAPGSSTNCRPTLEPWRTGFNTTGGRQPAGHAAVGASNTTKRPVGTPLARHRSFVATLSNASRLAAASQPV